MTGYCIDHNNGGICPAAQGASSSPFLIILNTAEFRDDMSDLFYRRELLHSLRSIRYCKAEQGKGCILGAIRVPQKSEQRTQLLSFGFYLTGQTLYLIEDTGKLKLWLEKQRDMLHDLHTPDQLLLQLMGRMIEDDILYLSHLEKAFEAMEDTLTGGAPKDFFLRLTRHRQKLSELNAYYEQLTAIGELMQLPSCCPLIQNAALWENYTKRCEQLQGYVHLLRENVLQLRELYQSLQGERQNKIMGMLTIVTTLFLPLTLLTGWYGMNFARMPELQWAYGYPVVIAVSALIVVAEIIFFKKARFF